MKALLIFTATLLVVSAAIAKPERKFVSLEERLMERAEKILIPRVDFQNTTVAEALEFLENEGQAHDPKHEGIAIEVHVDPWPMEEYLPASKSAKPIPPAGWPLYEPLKQQITLSLQDTSLAEAFRYAAGLANCRIGASRTALTLLPPHMATDPMVTHTIPLASLPKADLRKLRANPKQYFSNCGVIFYEDAGCTFEDNGRALVITNTSAQLDLVHAVLESAVRYEAVRESGYRLTISWDYWDDGNVGEGRGKWFDMHIWGNGEYIGTRETAFRFLETLPVEAGEHVKLDMPVRPAGNKCAPGHWESNFIQHWMEKGAFVDWYEGGKKFELHTVTWTDAIREDLNYVDNMDDLTWIVDGKKIGKGKNLPPIVERWKKTKGNLVIQIVTPLECDASFAGVNPGRYSPILESIKDGERIRVYHITPFRQILSESSRERPVEEAPAGSKLETPQIPGLEPPAEGQVLEFGLFEVVGPQQRVANARTLDGEQLNAEGARFSKHIDRIPAIPGVAFGFRYKVTGVTEQGTAEFKKFVTHPPIKNEKGEIESQYSTTETLSTKNGYVSEVSGYSLDRPEELVPGVWKFELWYHGQTVVSQSFTVYTPTNKTPAKVPTNDAKRKGAGETGVPRIPGLESPEETKK